jgi:hypothetical protein
LDLFLDNVKIIQYPLGGWREAVDGIDLLGAEVKGAELAFIG